jgi:chloramphenicol 3-O-phosphotransferase
MGLSYQEALKIAGEEVLKRDGKLDDGDEVFVIFKDAVVDFEMEGNKKNFKIRLVLGKPIFIDKFIENENK